MFLTTTVALCLVMQEPKAKAKAELPTAVRKYFEEADRQRQAAIEVIETRIKDRMAEAKKKRLSGPAAKKQGDEIKAMRAALEALQKNDPPFVPVIKLGTLEVGQVGALSQGEHRAAKSLATVRGDASTVRTFDGATKLEWRVLDVFGPREVLIEPTWYDLIPAPVKRTGKPFLVRGHDTSKMTSDRAIELPAIYHVATTHTYPTIAGGARTVLVLEILDIEDSEPVPR
jgi:hypothetical protein